MQEDLDINKLLLAMEDMYAPEEAEFEMVKALSNLQETCPVHGVGQKDLKIMDYTCPICKIALNETA